MNILQQSNLVTLLLPALGTILLLLSCINTVHAAAEKNTSTDDTTPSSTHTIPIISTTKKPNIVLILADDVGTGDIPVYWNSSAVDMPNLDRLARMGVTFKDAHSSSICAPSRYMLLSGNYAHRGFRPNGSWGFYENRNQFLDRQRSIAELLRDEAGYHTSMFGKWHLGAKAPPNGIATKESSKYVLTDPTMDWTLPLIGGPQDIGFTRSYMTIGGIQSPPYSFFRDGYLSTDERNITYWEEGSHETDHGMSVIGKTHSGEGDTNWDSTAYNMILVNETTRFIDEHLAATPSDPFFTYVALGSVHVPHSPPNHYMDGSPVKDEYPTRHLDMLLEMDKVVGSIVSHIEKRNITQDTIIIFTSDNGGLRAKYSYKTTGHRTGGPLRGEKRSIYEGGHRVPLIIRYDSKFPANEGRKKMVGLNDVYATICELVGVEIPYGSAQDSISFADYIESSTNKNGRRNRFASWTYGRNIVKEEAIRYGSMKLIRNNFNSAFQLYDLASDISESMDLSTNETYAKKMQIMYRKLKEIGPCPEDRDGQFSIGGMSKQKGCNWFRKKTNRCNRYLEGELYCSSVCGRNKGYCGLE